MRSERRRDTHHAVLRALKRAEGAGAKESAPAAGKARATGSSRSPADALILAQGSLLCLLTSRGVRAQVREAMCRSACGHGLQQTQEASTRPHQVAGFLTSVQQAAWSLDLPLLRFQGGATLCLSGPLFSFTCSVGYDVSVRGFVKTACPRVLGKCLGQNRGSAVKVVTPLDP